MIDFSFTEEQQLFRKAIHEWCQKRLNLEAVRQMDKPTKMLDGLVKEMADLDLLIMTAPEEHGGTGADWITAYIAAEELGYADISCAVPAM